MKSYEEWEQELNRCMFNGEEERERMYELECKIDRLRARLAAADRMADELDNMTLQYGCICGHPSCNRCEDTRQAKDALTAYAQTKEQEHADNT